MGNFLLPINLFTTRRRFNDFNSDDMHFGDISESRLKNEFGLVNISNRVDPYSLTRLTTFDNPQSMFAGNYASIRRGEKISIHQCAQLLFEEMQVISLPYSFIGPYRHLINKMLKHFQFSRGSDFSDHTLNSAYRDKILSNYATNQTRSVLHNNLSLYIDYDNKVFPDNKSEDLRSSLLDSVLPKFNSLLTDKINGMGVTVHDIYATKIDILRLDINNYGWKASVRFTGQDHFGLDITDIKKKKFNQFRFFKIWFILQRLDKFGFRPFMTNMEAVINIEGKR